MNHFADDQIICQIDAILEDRPQEKVVAFAVTGVLMPEQTTPESRASSILPACI
jgi:hypothetical protein